MSDSFDTWDGPRVLPPTSGREAHMNPEADPALLRSELAACRREIDRLRTELAECRAQMVRPEPCCDDPQLADSRTGRYCVNCMRFA